jgi:hypothetical protein
MDLAKKVFKLSLLGFVSAACGELDCDARRTSGWKHLLVTDEEHAAVLEEANQAEDAGELFPEGPAAGDEDAEDGEESGEPMEPPPEDLAEEPLHCRKTLWPRSLLHHHQPMWPRSRCRSRQFQGRL